MEFSEALRAWWGPAVAFAAGVVSVASPCVLPLLPGYLSFISGAQGEEDRRPLLPVLLFVLGFAVVFSALGAFSDVLGRAFRSRPGEIVAGSLIVVVGLLMLLYALRLGSPALFAERRPFLSRVRPGPIGAFPLGMAFAVGWTPCLGPVLAAILTLAAAQGGGAWGAVLLLFYSLGLGLPFVLVGLGVRRLTRALGFIRRNYHWFTGIGGAVLVAIGMLVATGYWLRFLVDIGLLRWIGGFEPPI